jgi:thiosulfate/3-mercaptopyruvate sulfurtransferase
MAEYAHPEVLVSTDWVRAHHTDDGVRVVEVDVDTTAYDSGHIPGAVGFNWQTELQDQVARDIVSRENFEKLVGGAGIAAGDTVVLYGDHNNWFAAYAYWLFRLYGHEPVRLTNGGRVKWLLDKSNPLTTEKPAPTPVPYRAHEANMDLRALLADTMEASRLGTHSLVDVRSPDEFSGRIIAPPGMNETAQRGGHIPGAVSVPWSTAVNEDGTFRSADELRRIYFEEKHVDPTRDAIAYCRIGERSSHTWFVLKYLLGVRNVKNYDGSWTEYGNMVGAPIEKTADSPVGAGT